MLCSLASSSTAAQSKCLRLLFTFTFNRFTTTTTVRIEGQRSCQQWRHTEIASSSQFGLRISSMKNAQRDNRRKMSSLSGQACCPPIARPTLKRSQSWRGSRPANQPKNNDSLSPSDPEIERNSIGLLHLSVAQSHLPDR